MSQELEGTLTNEINLVGTFGTTGGGTTNYNDLINKPSINNFTLQGNKTGSQLGLVSSTDIATVATTGSYNDLTNKPTIPAAQVNADWNSSSGVSEILNKPTLATVATSGSYDDLTNKPTLATVATSGSYDDLTNKPTIPAAQVNADWNSTSGVSEILNKPTLATVATSGSYNDLTNTPSIPVNSDFALSGLPDTDITTPSANQVLAYDGSKWGNVTPTYQDKFWKRLSSSFELTGNNTGTWSFTDNLSTTNYTDILFTISLVSWDSGVRSSMMLSRLGFEAYGVFYDYTIGSDRMYFQLVKATNTSFTVSNTNLGGITSKVFVTAYYR